VHVAVDALLVFSFEAHVAGWAECDELMVGCVGVCCVVLYVVDVEGCGTCAAECALVVVASYDSAALPRPCWCVVVAAVAVMCLVVCLLVCGASWVGWCGGLVAVDALLGGATDTGRVVHLMCCFIWLYFCKASRRTCSGCVPFCAA
jgi:hypothetical protein